MILFFGGIFGSDTPVTTLQGFQYFIAGFPIGIVGWFSAIAQGRAAVASIALFAKRPSEFAKGMVSTTLVEIYALLGLLVSLLAVIFIK